MPTEERAREGVFLAMQYPVEIPGVNNIYFLKAALNAMRKHRGEEELDAMEFLQLAREKMKVVELDEVVHEPRRQRRASPAARRSATRSSRWPCSIRSWPSSTRPTPASTSTRCASSPQGVNTLRSEHHSVLVITHYQRLLRYLVPDFVHVLANGRIVKSGGKELAEELEQKGYDWIEEEVA